MEIVKLCLALSIVLGLLHIFSLTAIVTNQRGLKWNMGPRDLPASPLGIKAHRFDRALQNFKETYPFFVAAVVLSISTNRSSIVAETGAIVYVIARIIYVPLYLFNVAGIRSLVWMISIVGIAGLLVDYLLQHIV